MILPCKRIGKDELRWHDLMRFVISWGLRRRPREESEKLKEAITQSQSERTHKNQVKTMTETAFQTLADIMEEGEVRGRRDSLQHLLANNFQNVPQDLLDRIDAIDDPARLAELFDRALKAKSLDELAS